MVERWQIIVVQILIFVIACMAIAFFIVTVLTCSPVKYFWTQATDPYAVLVFLGDTDPGKSGLKPKGHCHSDVDYGMVAIYAQIGLTIVVDIMLGIVMPFAMLRNLNMRRSIKSTAFVVLALGALPSVASIIRLFYAHTFANSNALNSANPLFVWSNVEITWCQIGTALTTLKPLAHRLGFFKRDSSYSSGASPYNRNKPSPRFGPESRRRRGWLFQNSRRRDRGEVETTMAEGTTATVWGDKAAAAINDVGMTDISKHSPFDSQVDIVSWRPSDRESATVASQTDMSRSSRKQRKLKGKQGELGSNGTDTVDSFDFDLEDKA